MRYRYQIIIILLFVVLGLTAAIRRLPTTPVLPVRNNVTALTGLLTTTQTPTPTPLPISRILDQQEFVSQSFNNCGPATLSMLYSQLQKTVSQGVLGDKLRPYQHPTGDNDDKSVTLSELAVDAQSRGFIAFYRPNGSLDMIKAFIAAGIPLIVRQSLHHDEDIAHFRLIRGYDDLTETIITDDSYLGPNVTLSYTDFVKMWQPYQYDFLVIGHPQQESMIQAILGNAVNINTAWTGTLKRAEREASDDPSNPYPIFNKSIAHFYLGNYTESIQLYEQISTQLPPRTLWYQTEPIAAYLKTRQFEKVFELTAAILSNQNRGYSELYLFRGDADLAQGKFDEARGEFEKAVFYNQNLTLAQTKLAEVTKE